MKRTFLYSRGRVAFLAVLFLTLLSCQKEVLPVLIVPTTDLSIPYSGGSDKIEFISNKSWIAQSSEDWCKISPSLGAANDIETAFSIIVSCDENPSYDYRQCSISLTSGSLSQVITVTQDREDAIVVSEDSFALSYNAQTLSIPFESNFDVSVSIPQSCQDWIKVVSTKGISSHILMLDISENSGNETRRATITLANVNSSVSAEISIIQNPALTPYGFWVVDKLETVVSLTINGETTQTTHTTDFSHENCYLNLDPSNIATLWFNLEWPDSGAFSYNYSTKSIEFKKVLDKGDNGKAIVLLGVYDVILEGKSMILHQPEATIGNIFGFGGSEQATYYLHRAPENEIPRE